MVAEDRDYNVVPKDLYINADSKTKCKYSRVPCLRCTFKECKDEFPNIKSFVANEKYEIVQHCYRKGMSAQFIALLFDTAESIIDKILKSELSK